MSARHLSESRADTRDPSEVLISLDVLQALMRAGNRLAQAAEQHWDEIPMGVVLAEWQDALFAAGRSAR